MLGEGGGRLLERIDALHDGPDGVVLVDELPEVEQVGPVGRRGEEVVLGEPEHAPELAVHDRRARRDGSTHRQLWPFM